MKAEREDVPDYLRTRKKASPWRFLAIVGIGSAVFWGLAMMFGKPIVIDIDRIKSAIRFADNPVFVPERQQKPMQPAEPLEISKHAALHDLLSSTRNHPAPTPTPKQTSFNDQNYQPRGAINSIAPPPARYYAKNPSNSTQARSVTRQTFTNRWRWENGHAKNPVGGNFLWTVVDGQIDYNSVCNNYRRGSLIYRDCRKGAKVEFKRICSQYKPACAAENNYLP